MKTKALQFSRFIAMTIILCVCITPAAAQNSQVHWSAFTAGFGASSSTHTSVTSAIGPLVGTTGDGSSGISSGFLTNTAFTGPLTAIGEPLETELPSSYELKQNYPNPFNPATRIPFSLPTKSAVRLSIYDLLGREVVNLIAETRPAGNHVVDWDGLNAIGQRISSGMYFYRLEAEGFAQTRKLTLLK